MKSGTASILNAYLRPKTIRLGSKVMRLLLSAAMLGMLFPLQPEMPCADTKAAAQQTPDYMLSQQELPVGLVCDSEAQRLLICDLLPAQSVNCLKQTEAVAPQGNNKIPAHQYSVDFSAGSSNDAYLSRGCLHWQTFKRLNYLSYTPFPGPARAPPFRTA